jgi:2-polyprenyl-3-methyl-5-hydroxy-6-metoxy-1,4-benzoquinol methylase
VLAEVTNTPWGERYSYLLSDRTPASPVRGGRFAKELHVSPFMGMDHVYQARATRPGSTLSVHIESHREGRLAFDAALAMQRGPLTRGAVARMTTRYPAATARGAGTHLRTCRGAQASRRTRPPPPRGGGSVTERESGPSRAVASLLLNAIRVGSLTIVEGEARRTFGSGPPTATIHVRHPQFWPMLMRGSRGLAESFAQGMWDSPDLVAVIRLAARNAVVIDRVRAVTAPLWKPRQRVREALKRRTRKRSRRGIAAHYDLGNELFARMLDPTVMYSCALFERPGMTLEGASVAKLERVCERLELGPEDRVLEIGTGWGGFAVHAAATRGCRVITTTISREQHDYTLTRIREAGLEDRVTVLMRDYRDLRGRFDKLVSIEMIEAVGWQQIGRLFAHWSDLLTPHGAMLLQAVTIDDRA